MLATGSTLFPFLASEARLRHRAGRDITKVVAVDLFAGGGGVSLGIKWATGRAPLVAVNHCEHAIKIHRLNHPETRHYQESVGDVNPRLACMGKHIDLLWLSPDCTDHSRAKGGKPRSTGRRHLADCALDWARDVAPDVIILENVPEFEDWGPLHPDDHPNPKLRGQPDRARRGQEFKRWCEALAAFGYVMEWRKLVCADYGDPTTRKRFFLIARCDGEPIVWPVPSHGPKAEQPWGIVADCIDWSIPACSIFASPAEAKAWGRAHRDRGVKGTPRRPLAEKTLRRVAEGMKRYVLGKRRPFLVCLTHEGDDPSRAESLDQPMRTITGAHRGERALVSPMVVRAHAKGSDQPGSPAGITPGDQPAPTITATQEWAVMVPSIVQITHRSSTDGCKVKGVGEPISTVVGKAEHMLASAALVRASEVVPEEEGAVEQGAPTAAGAAATALLKFYGTSTGAPADGPCPTITGGAGGGHFGAMAVHLQHHRSRSIGQEVVAPLGAATGHAHHSVLAAHLVNTRNGEREGQAPRALSVEDPMPTVTGKGSQGAVVGAWLVKHYGGVIGQDMDRPIGTVTGRDHHGVVNAELRAAALVTNNTGNPPSPVDGPLKTVTSGRHHALIGAELHSAPLGRAREVAAFLIKYHGNGGQWAPCDEALHTVDGTARFGLVQVELRRWMVQGQDGGFYGVEVDGEVYAAVIIDGEAWIIVDITIRMLRARELGRASGFPDSYVFEGTEEQQIERIGNAVPPHVVQALVTAQFRPARRLQEPTAKKAGTKARPMRAGGATSAGASPDRRQREERERQAGGGG